MKKININVSGMHCHSCELIMEKSIKKLPGVIKVSANQRKGTIEIHYEEGKKLDLNEVEKIVIENGYAMGIEKTLPWFNRNPDDYVDILMIGMFLYIAFLVLKGTGISVGNFGSVSSPTLGVSFLIGLTAGLSSCMALVGGLILGISANWNKNNIASSRWSRFEPHLYFNLGRILGFGVFGGILGLFGSFISLSNIFLGIMTFLVGAIMLMLGLNLTNISPKLGNITLTLPKFLGKNIGSDNGSGKTGAMITGAMSFFLPCGFTLAMQMYAISTGSFMLGALSLGFFAIGTSFGLIGIGGLTAILKGIWAKRFFKFTGTIVLLLGFFNLANGYTLLSLGIPSANIKQNIDTTNLGTQEVRMTQDDGGYSPSIINIKPNTKIKLIITSTNPYTCASQIIIPSLGISKSLKQGENVIEFVSPDSGEIRFSCSMGMYTGKFIIGDGSSSVSQSNNDQQQIESQAQRGGGCSMMGGGSNSRQQIPTETTGSSNNLQTDKNNGSENNVQTINLEYTSAGLSSNVNVEKGKTYKIIIDIKDTISGCMSTILIPGLDENIQRLQAGNKIVFNITPTQSGQFPITCAMGVPHGYINVQ